MKTDIWSSLPAAPIRLQLLLIQLFTRIVRAAGDCAREDYLAVYGMVRRRAHLFLFCNVVKITSLACFQIMNFF
ncbi:MAG TPA: hypothetical protein DEB39_11350 [Planctomycetaceae bacterium]|nr:hypothetical protein [Planctomycetaceae bacterium]